MSPVLSTRFSGHHCQLAPAELELSPRVMDGDENHRPGGTGCAAKDLLDGITRTYGHGALTKTTRRHDESPPGLNRNEFRDE